MIETDDWTALKYSVNIYTKGIWWYMDWLNIELLFNVATDDGFLLAQPGVEMKRNNQKIKSASDFRTDYEQPLEVKGERNYLI